MPGSKCFITYCNALSVIPIAVAVLRGDGPLDVDWFDLPSGGIVTVRLDESVS